MEDFVQVYEEARTRLKWIGAPPDEMDSLWRDVRHIQDRHWEEAPLAELRELIRQFRVTWRVPYSLS